MAAAVVLTRQIPSLAHCARGGVHVVMAGDALALCGALPAAPLFREREEDERECETCQHEFGAWCAGLR